MESVSRHFNVCGIIVNESTQKVSNKVFTFMVRKLLSGGICACIKLIFKRKQSKNNWRYLMQKLKIQKYMKFFTIF